MAKCQNCGAQLNGDKICQYCGIEIEEKIIEDESKGSTRNINEYEHKPGRISLAPNEDKAEKIIGEIWKSFLNTSLCFNRIKRLAVIIIIGIIFIFVIGILGSAILNGQKLIP